MWIIHSDISFCFLKDPITHQHFQVQLAKDLAVGWEGRKQGYSILAPFTRSPHGPKSRGKKQGNCRICGQRTNQWCLGC